jgi:hypothetical protein
VREVPVCWEEVRSELEPGTERIVGVDVVVVRGMNSGRSATYKDRETEVISSDCPLRVRMSPENTLANLPVKDLHVLQSYRLDAWFDDQRGLAEVVVPRAASLIEGRFRFCCLVVVVREVCFVQ